MAPKPSSGPSTKKISIVISGSTWAWLRNARTLRPVSSSIVSWLALGHDALEVLAHGDDAVGLAAVHDRPLERRESAAAHDDDDDVVGHVGSWPSSGRARSDRAGCRRCWSRLLLGDVRLRASGCASISAAPGPAGLRPLSVPSFLFPMRA